MLDLLYVIKQVKHVEFNVDDKTGKTIYRQKQLRSIMIKHKIATMTMSITFFK